MKPTLPVEIENNLALANVPNEDFPMIRVLTLDVREQTLELRVLGNEALDGTANLKFSQKS